MERLGQLRNRRVGRMAARIDGRPVYFDWVDNALVFEVLSPRDKHVYGTVWLPSRTTVYS